MKPKAQRHPLLLLTVVLLPFSYVPHEIIRSGPSLAPVSLALILIVGAKYGVWSRGPATAVDAATKLLIAWILLRLLVLAAFDDAAWPVGFALAESLSYVAGLTLYRVARVPELRPTLIRGLRIVFAILVLAELYQLAAGLPRLLSLGYVAPEFNYNTSSGEYRPFGTFVSPVGFGAYLALIGLAVIFTSRKASSALFFFAVTVGALALTETRGAWIAFAVGLGVALFMRSNINRQTVVLVAGHGLLVLLAVVLWKPGLFTNLTDRLLTIGDLEYSSNSIRLALWDATLHAAGQAPVAGYGAAPFQETMRPLVGDLAAFGHPHNNYLQVLYIYGAVGLILFLAVLAAMLRQRRTPGAVDTQLAVMSVAVLMAFVMNSMTEMTISGFNLVATLFLLVGLGAPEFLPRGSETRPGQVRGRLSSRSQRPMLR